MKKRLLYLLSAVIALTLTFSACGGDDVKSVPASGVSLSETSLTLTIGQTKTLTATVLPENAANKAVDWQSSDTTVASVSANGAVTALKAGAAAISVITQEGNHTARCALTVPALSVTGVSLDKTALELFVGGMYTLLETIAPANATDKAVSWSSDNPAIANVSNDGVVMAFAPGMAMVSLRTQDGGYTASCAVSVSPAPIVPVKSIRLNKTTVTFAVGSIDTLIATVSPGHATNMAVSWSSSNSEIISVSNGTIRALAEGEETITVVSLADPEIKATCQVTSKPFLDPTATVYVLAGSGVWVNGVTQSLSNSGGYSVTDMAVAKNGDVYVTGYTDNTWPPTPRLWRNGQTQTLSTPNGGRAFAVFAAENALASDGVYVGGEEGSSAYPGQGGPRVWKDGQILYRLPSPALQRAAVQSIYVSGDDVYSAGFDLNAAWMVMATVWKNDQILYRLTDGAAYGGNAYSIVAHNGDVYTAGAAPVLGLPVVITRAVVWKNDAPTYLTDGRFEAVANDVFVTADGHVYVAGYESNEEGNAIATIWKDGEVYMRLNDGDESASANSVFVLDDEVYAAGSGSIWRNNLRLRLGGNTRSIYVRRN